MEPAVIGEPYFSFVSVKVEPDDRDSISSQFEIDEQPDLSSLKIELCTTPDINMMLLPEASGLVPTLSITQQDAASVDPLSAQLNIQDIEDQENFSIDRTFKTEGHELSIDVKPSMTSIARRNLHPFIDHVVPEVTNNLPSPLDFVVKREPDAFEDYNFQEENLSNLEENYQMKYSVKQELDLASDEDTEYNPDESDTSNPEDSDYRDKTWRSPGPSKSRSTKKQGKSPSGFTCDMCCKRYKSKFDLVRHLTTKNPDVPCKLCCQICQKPCRNRRELSIHVKVHSEPHVCNICSKTFTSFGNFKRHVGRHTDVFSFECDVCKKLFKQKENLSKHMQIHSEKKFKCPICPKFFSRSTHLRRHLNIHELGEKQFKCEICPFKQFAKLAGLKKHMLIHNPGNMNKCSDCPEVFRRLASLLAHQKNAHGPSIYKCIHCECLFKREKYLKRHLLSHVSEEMPYRCEVCNVKLTSKRGLIDHRRTHKVRTYSCSVCKTDFKGKSFLKRHISQVHPKRKMINCELCNRKFSCISSSWSFQNHIKKCPTKKLLFTFQCLHCEKKYTREDSLKFHSINHISEEIPYSCGKCSEVLTSKRDYMEHRKKHVVLYMCPICEANFKTKSDLIGHIRNVHADKKKMIRYEPDNKKFVFVEGSAKSDLLPKTSRAMITKEQFECPLCKKQCQAHGILRGHLKLHVNGFKCTECPQVFRSQGGLDNHITETHCTSVNCPICDKVTRAKCLASHCLRMHTSVDRPYKCKLCSEVITSYDAVKVHRKIHVVGSFPCPICKYECRGKDTLERHMWRHSNPYTFHLCQQCGKGFGCSNHLEQHIKTHSLSHPFRCDPCGKSYRSKRILRFHMLLHFREDQYGCDACGKSFLRLDKLQAHLKYHVSLQYQCDVCERSFRNKSNLRIHCESHIIVT